MANEALIQGAKYAYGAGTSAASAMVQANISRQTGGSNQAMQMAAMQRKAKKKTIEANIASTVKTYVDSIPPDFDVSQIPEKYRGAISSKLLEMKQKAAQAARDITQYQPGEVGYQQNVDIINGVKNAMNNMKTQFSTFGKDKAEFLEDYQNKNFSEANDPEGKMNSLSQLYTDNLNLRIGDDGNLFFGGNGVEEFNLNTANQDAPFSKANDEAKTFLELNKSIYNAGKPISEAERLMHGNQISNMLDKGGWPVTQSFLYDDLFGSPLSGQISTVNIDGKSYTLDQAVEMANSSDTGVSVGAREAINDAVKNQLLGHLDNSAKSGRKSKGDGKPSTPADSVETIMPNIGGTTDYDSLNDPDVQNLTIVNAGQNPHTNLDGSLKDGNTQAQADKWTADNSTNYAMFPNVTNSYGNKVLLYDEATKKYIVGTISEGSVTPSGIFIKGDISDAKVKAWINKNFK